MKNLIPFSVLFRYQFSHLYANYGIFSSTQIPNCNPLYLFREFLSTIGSQLLT